MTQFNQVKSFIQLNTPIVFKDFECIGYFPYEHAGIYQKVKVPRKVYDTIESILRDNGIHDNKFVAVFKDTVNFGTEDFAIFFKDMYATIGPWDSVVHINSPTQWPKVVLENLLKH